MSIGKCGRLIHICSIWASLKVVGRALAGLRVSWQHLKALCCFERIFVLHGVTGQRRKIESGVLFERPLLERTCLVFGGFCFYT